MQTITTPQEVIRYSPTRNDFPPNELIQAIYRFEKIFFKDCLKDLYDAMKESVVQYDYVCFEKNQSYGAGVFVLFNGIIYESLVSSNDTIPKEGPRWKEPVKFSDPEVESIWNEVLKYLISYNVLLRVITFTTMQSGSKGLIVFTEDDSNIKGATNKDVIEFKRELNFSINEYQNIFQDIINESNSDIFVLCKSGCGNKSEELNIVNRNRRVMVR
jgi:hypothetical protein